MEKIIVAVVILYFVFFKKSDMQKIKGNAPEALNDVANKYGIDFAREIEQAMRLETRHFKSGQWLQCGSAGMVATSKQYPFGWSSLEEFCNKNGISSEGFTTVHFSNTSEGAKEYIRFPETGIFIRFFAWFIQKKRGGNVAAWYRIADKDYNGNGIGDQTEYRNKYKNISTKFV